MRLYLNKSYVGNYPEIANIMGCCLFTIDDMPDWQVQWLHDGVNVPRQGLDTEFRGAIECPPHEWAMGTLNVYASTDTLHGIREFFESLDLTRKIRRYGTSAVKTPLMPPGQEFMGEWPNDLPKYTDEDGDPNKW
jgi:hypothetical protein